MRNRAGHTTAHTVKQVQRQGRRHASDDAPLPPGGWEPRDPTVHGTGAPPGDRARPGAARGTPRRRTLRRARRAERRAARRRRRTGWRRLVPTWRMLARRPAAEWSCSAPPPSSSRATTSSASRPPTPRPPPRPTSTSTPTAAPRPGRQGEPGERPPLPRPGVPAARRPRGRGPRLPLRTESTPKPSSAPPGTPSAARAPRRLHHHPAVRQELLPRAGTHPHPQGEGVLHRHQARPAHLQDHILEGCLNTSYYGRNAYGVQAAARAYYGKDVDELGTAEGAYLAALLNAPQRLRRGLPHREPDPRAGPLEPRPRRAWSRNAGSPRRNAPGSPSPPSPAARPAAGLSGQRGCAVQAVNAYLTRHGIVGAASSPPAATASPPPCGRTASTPSPTRSAPGPLRLDPDARPVDRYVRVGGASVEPATGKVVALYGGIGYTRQYVNNATRRDYQVGSTFKPFVYAAAVDRGATTQYGEPITPDTVYDGTNKRPVEGWTGSPYAPANEDDHSYGGITLRTATDRSVNAVYAQLAVDVGPKAVERTAVALGLPPDTPDLNASPSIALGPATASVLDMAAPTPPSPTTGGAAAPTPSSRGQSASAPAARSRSRCPPPSPRPPTAARPARPSAGRPRTPRRRCCAASSRAAPAPRRAPSGGPPPARRAPRRTTRPPGSPATPRSSPPSSP